MGVEFCYFSSKIHVIYVQEFISCPTQNEIVSHGEINALIFFFFGKYRLFTVGSTVSIKIRQNAEV